MRICLILDEPEHEITFLEDPGFNPAAMITAQVLLVNRLTGCRHITLFVQQVKSILARLFIIRLNVSRHSR